MAWHWHTYTRNFYTTIEVLGKEWTLGYPLPWTTVCEFEGTPFEDCVRCGSGHSKCLKRTDIEYTDRINLYILNYAAETYCDASEDTVGHTHSVYVFSRGVQGPNGYNYTLLGDEDMCPNGHLYCDGHFTQSYTGGAQIQYHYPNRDYAVISTNSAGSGNHRHSFTGDTYVPAERRSIVDFKTCGSGHENCQCEVTAPCYFSRDSMGTKYTSYSGDTIPAPREFPTDNMARVASIRRIYHPGLYRMELGFGDLGIDIDVADMGVKKIVEGVETPGVECQIDSDCPNGYACIGGKCVLRPTTPTTKKVIDIPKLNEAVTKQIAEGWMATQTGIPGVTPDLPLGATKSTQPMVPLNLTQAFTMVFKDMPSADLLSQYKKLFASATLLQTTDPNAYLKLTIMGNELRKRGIQP